MEDLNYLILVRHGQSEWNAKNLFTGWKDPDLTDQGRNEAEKAGKTSVPQIWIDDKHIGGCDDLYALYGEGSLEKLLSD